MNHPLGDHEPGPGVLKRVPTGISGLDTVLEGGLVAGDAYLVMGTPGTGKTTLGNHLAFNHAARGGTSLIVTLLTETHDRMLGHLRGFAFFDPTLAGGRVRYLSLLRPLEERGVEGLLEALRQAVRDHDASLLVVDGTGAAEELAPSGFAYGRFVYGLQARTASMGCTTVLLSNGQADGSNAGAIHVDGLIELVLQTVDWRDERWLRLEKLRGSDYLNGRHQFSIDESGVRVFPRLEAALGGGVPAVVPSAARVAFGVAGLDEMLEGGLPAGSTTMVLGTPGAGKSLLGSHFLVEGAERGEVGLVATFHESPAAMSNMAGEVGAAMARHFAEGRLHAMWRPPLELSPDAWAWELLDRVAEIRPNRLVVDAFTDLVRLFSVPQRQVPFLTALANKLREREVTTLVHLELDEFSSPNLLPPVPPASAAMDAAILLRTAELDSRLVRILAVLKARQTGFDHTLRHFAIGAHGIELGRPVSDATGVLTGTGPAVPASPS